ncbi:syntaxin-binding protein 5 isoform X2 [Microplitis mediator]|uniref:syntaxin-binding protein 5 isoform X2 n=1 Tax=Microplitis mediator TaxID=375433 RepID=UPI0025546F1B|nr:syntaxin-binding protein 5 isoform X2 [Microplitis mediator]
MKKFTIKGVLDGFRSSVAQQVKPDQEIIENLRSEHFQVKRTFRHGFPHQPTAVAFDPVQKLLAIGTKSGSLRLLGRPGVDVNIKHEGGAAVIQLEFLINEGALISVTADDTLHLWNLRQKIPQVIQSLKFQRERITSIHLPLQSKWLYVGTERGNIHVLHIETFVLSGYVINWNKAIEVSRKSHPGAVIHLSDNPLDLSKILIGYESGQISLWDLKLKAAEWRCQTDEPLRSISWHHEGKQFMCSHTDGSLSTWFVKQAKPINVTHPHAKLTKDGEPEPCKSIQKVEWKLSRSGEAYIIFSGGLAYEATGRTPSITVIQGKTTTVLEMEHNVVDFITLCDSPYTSDFQDPHAVVVLLQNDLVVIDLLTPGFPCFENPYPMDLHESAVTCCAYFADCPSDLVPAFYSVGSKSQKKTGFSEKEWPISGGEWSPNSSSYNEIIITGHADGSIKFWDASAGSLQVLYKLKTAKLFEKCKTKSLDNDDDPLAIQLIFLCPESRKLAIAGAGRHVILFKFKKVESMSEVVTLEISLTGDNKDTEGSPDPDLDPCQIPGVEESRAAEAAMSLKVRGGLQKRAAGFQATLICLTSNNGGEQTDNITSLSLNSSYGLLAYGNETGLAIVDIIQKVKLLVLSTTDIGNTGDPYQRALRSPKRQDDAKKENEDKARSPSIDQIHRESTPDYESLVAVGEKSSAFCTSVSSHHFQQLSSQQQQQAPQQQHHHHHHQQQQFIDDCHGLHSDTRDTDSNVKDGTLAVTTTPTASRKTGVDANEDEIRDKKPWKSFSLKRQLSRVDIKIKNTFTPSTALTSSSTTAINGKQVSQSTFYRNPTEVSPGLNDEITTASTTITLSSSSSSNKSPVSTRSLRTEKHGLKTMTCELSTITSPSDVSDDNDDSDDNNQQLISPITDNPIRPIDLPLLENNDKLMELHKKRLKGRHIKTRLLSVPNSKNQKLNNNNYNDGLFTRNDDNNLTSTTGMTSNNESFAGNLMRRFSRADKFDSTFQRSRSSSMSSLENISTETISCLTFADCYIKKPDISVLPTLWIGTSLGSIQTVVFNLPVHEDRQTQPVIISTSNGLTFKLKGCILTISFLDCNGTLIPYSYESWKDENIEGKERNRGAKSNSRMSPLLYAQTSNTTGEGCDDRQFVVLISEKQARVVALPSQNCIYRQQLSETHAVIKAEITSMKDSVCLVCYVSNGHISTYSLPSLRPLIDVDFLPLQDLSFQTTKHGIVDPMLSIWGHQLFVNGDTDQISKTVCFSNRGHALYLSSPTEIQKFSISNEFCSELTEMMGDLFSTVDMPEAPKESFFKGLFGGGTRNIDREELFGESSGRASRTIAKHIPGPNANPEALRERVSTATGEVAMAHQMVMERGDKLSQLEERTARMMNESENFATSAHGLMHKYKDKKWYQL